MMWEDFMTPTVVQTGVTCLAAQLILHIVFAYILPKGPWTQLPSFTAHQAVCLPLMLYFSYVGFAGWFGNNDHDGKFTTFEARVFGETYDPGVYLGEMAFGFLLFWDIPVGFTTPQLQDKLMAVHHVAMAFVSAAIAGFFSSGIPIGSYYAPFYLGVIEFSSVFLNIHDLFHPKHKYWYEYMQTKQGPMGDTMRAVNEVCKSLFAVLFIVLRGVYFPYVMFTQQLSDFWNAATSSPETRPDTVPSWPIWMIFWMSFFFCFLQMYWGVLVAKGIGKALGIIPDNKKKQGPKKKE